MPQRDVKICYTGPAAGIFLSEIGERPRVEHFADDPAVYFLVSADEAARLESNNPTAWQTEARAQQLAEAEAAALAPEADAGQGRSRRPRPESPPAEAPASE